MNTGNLKKYLSLLIFSVLMFLSEHSIGQPYISFGMNIGHIPDPYSFKVSFLDKISSWRWKKETVYDTALVRIQYRMSFWNPEHTKKYYDNRIVSIGRNGFKKDGSELLEFIDNRNPGSLREDSLQYFSLDSPVYPAEYFIDPQGKSWTLFRTTPPGPILRYEEKTARFEWVLLSQIDTIAGYLCQKAETSYQGRKYEAWYCPNMVMDAGPYKFCGLPGLIVKIEDTAGDYSWEMTGIEKSDRLVSEKQFVVQKSTRNQARKFIADMFEKPYSFLSQLLGEGGILMFDEFQNIRPPGAEEFAVSLYYRPIELE